MQLPHHAFVAILRHAVQDRVHPQTQLDAERQAQVVNHDVEQPVVVQRAHEVSEPGRAPPIRVGHGASLDDDLLRARRRRRCPPVW